MKFASHIAKIVESKKNHEFIQLCTMPRAIPETAELLTELAAGSDAEKE